MSLTERVVELEIEYTALLKAKASIEDLLIHAENELEECWLELTEAQHELAAQKAMEGQP